MSRPSTAKIVADAIKDGKQPADIFAACMEAMDKAGQRRDRFTDAAQPNEVPASDGGGAAETDEFAASLKKHVKARAKSVRPNYSRN